MIVLLFLASVVCIALAIVVNVVYGTDDVYAHFSYIPIVLAGIWYPRYAVLFAAALGVIHIASDYAVNGAFRANPWLRSSVFVFVAYLTSYVVMKREGLFRALRESKERLELAIKNAPMAVFDQDRDLRYTSIWNTNPGFDHQAVIGKTDADLFSAEEAAHMTAIKRRVMKTGMPAREEVCGTIRGRTVFFDLSVEPVQDTSGTIKGVCCAAYDITKSRRTMTALIHSRDLMRYIIEHNRSAIAVHDRALRYLYVSQRYMDDYKVRERDIIGKHHYEVFPDLPEKWRIVHQKALAGEVSSGDDDPYIREDGRVDWTRWECRPWYEADGAIGGIVVYTEIINEQKRVEEELRESAKRLRLALGTTVQAIAAVIETRDPYTAGHQRRVADLARAIATEMGLPSDRVDGLRLACLMHDVGKIAVPSEILTMPRKLTTVEFKLIQTHVKAGYDILKDIEFPWPLARMVLEHHERLDGSGYPNGLTGESLLLESRILAVSDVIEAMAMYRPYRPAIGIESALDEIRHNRGILYDPAVVDACLRLFDEKGYQIKA